MPGAVAEADEAEPPIAAVPGTLAPEPVPDEPEPMVDEPEPVELEPAVVLDQVEAVAFEPAETEFEDLQLAHAGAWAIPADLVGRGRRHPNWSMRASAADASPAPGEPEWSVEAEPRPSLDIAPDEEPYEEPEFVIEVEALPDLPEGEPPTEPAFELEPEEVRPAVVAEHSAVEPEPEPEPVDFDAERYTSIIDQPDWFAAEADDWSTGTTSSEATGVSEETQGPTAIEPPFEEPDAPEADAPERDAPGPEATRPELRESGADEMEVAGGGQVASAGPGIAVGGRAPGLARARRGAGGLRRPRHGPDGRTRGRRGMATGGARRLSGGAIGPGLERVCLAAFVPLHDAEQRGHAGVSPASSDLPDLRPVEARPQFDPSTALIIADLQNDFADPAGSLAVSGADRVILAVNAAVAAAVAAGGAVALTQDWHPESTPHFAKDGGIWPVHCVAGDVGRGAAPRR